MKPLIVTVLLLLSNISYSKGSDWEYISKTRKLLGDKHVTDILNKMANDNWELITCGIEKAQLTCIFRKPK